MELMLLLWLAFAHVIGDFYLQPMSWIEDRRARHAKSKRLYAHGSVHALLAWMALEGSGAEWLAAAIGALHILVDLVKSYADRSGRSWKWFLVDQAAHVVVLVAVADQASLGSITDTWNMQAPHLPLMAITLAVLGLARPVGFFIRNFTYQWEAELGDQRTDNLPGAGMWIGIIERLLVLVFVLSGALEAIGFLLAAKSVFRFGDLRDGTDRKRTEYVLVGTLLSFAIAFVVALCVRRLVRGSWTDPA